MYHNIPYNQHKLLISNSILLKDYPKTYIIPFNCIYDMGKPSFKKCHSSQKKLDNEYLCSVNYIGYILHLVCCFFYGQYSESITLLHHSHYFR